MNVLITGGSRGIGLSIAKRLSRAGHRVLIAARDAAALEEAKKTLAPDALAYAADVGDPSAAEALLQYAEAADFAPDALLLNAAAFADGTRSLIKPDAAELERVLRVNLLANYRLVQAFLPAVRKSRYPRLVFIGSTAALRSDSSLYGISKAALRNYALGLREELKPLGVGVTLLNPGGTLTERRAASGNSPEDRLLESDDIAKLVEVLLTLSPQAVVEELNVRPMLGDTY